MGSVFRCSVLVPIMAHICPYSQADRIDIDNDTRIFPARLEIEIRLNPLQLREIAGVKKTQTKPSLCANRPLCRINAIR